MAQKDDKLGLGFKKLEMPKKIKPLSGSPAQPGGDNLSALANIAKLAGTIKQGISDGRGLKAGEQTAPLNEDVATNAAVTGETTAAPLSEDVTTAPITGEVPAGLGIEGTVNQPERVSGPFKVFDVKGKEVGMKGSAVSTPQVVTRQPEVSTLEGTGPIKVEPTITPGPGVEEAQPKVEEPVQTAPATPEEAETAIAEQEEKEPGFFDKLGPEGKQALVRALLAGGTSILEAAGPGSSAAIISRGALTGTTAFDQFLSAQAKGGAAKRKEARTVAGEEREKARLGLEERRVRVAEREKPVKETATAEGRTKKAEAKAAETVRKEGGGIEEQLEAAESAREVQKFIEGRGVVEAEGVPAETPGLFGRLFGAEAKPAIPPKIKFPRRVSPSVEKVRRGVEGRQKTPRGLQPIGTDKRTGRPVFRDAQGNTFLGG